MSAEGAVVMENKNKSLHEGHRQRLRKRFRNDGLDNFEQHEVLELVLQYSIYQKDTNPLAHSLLNNIGTLSDVLDAEPEELKSVPNIGERSAVLLKLVRALGEQYALDTMVKKEVFDTAEKAASYSVQQYLGITDVRFSAMLFDGNFNLIAFESLGELSWYNPARMNNKVAELVFRYSAPYYAIVRNAPDGVVTPNNVDTAGAVALLEALKKFGRYMLEYIIISESNYMPVLKYIKNNNGGRYGLNRW